MIKQLCFLIFFLISFNIKGQSQSRIYVNEYLNIGVGARGLAMGGAQYASVNDATASYWNPAGLSSITQDFQISAMHAEYFGGISSYDFVGLAKTLKKKKATLALSFIRFGTDNIPYTLEYVRPDGSFDESKLKGIGAGDYAGFISFSKELNFFKNSEIKSRLGANAKVIYRHIGNMGSAWGVGLDAGMQIDYRKWNFGAVIKDVSSTYTAWSFNLTDAEKQIFGQTGNEIPVKSYEIMYPRLGLGTAYHFTKPERKIGLMAEIGMDITFDGKRKTVFASNMLSVDPRIGIEADYKKIIFLRAGVNNFYQVFDNTDTTHNKSYLMYQPSVGLGLKLGMVNIDYAFTRLNVQGAPLMSHIISAKVNFLKKEKESKKEEPNTEKLPTLEPIQ